MSDGVGGGDILRFSDNSSNGNKSHFREFWNFLQKTAVVIRVIFCFARCASICPTRTATWLWQHMFFSSAHIGFRTLGVLFLPCINEQKFRFQSWIPSQMQLRSSLKYMWSLPRCPHEKKNRWMIRSSWLYLISYMRSIRLQSLVKKITTQTLNAGSNVL